MKLPPKILLQKGTSTPVASLMKGQGGNAPVMHPLSFVLLATSPIERMWPSETDAWFRGFDSRLGHTKLLKNGTCGQCSLQFLIMLRGKTSVCAESQFLLQLRRGILAAAWPRSLEGTLLAACPASCPWLMNRCKETIHARCCH